MAQRRGLAGGMGSSRRNTGLKGIGKACVEALEGRVLLAVTAGEYASICSTYPGFNLPASMASVNIIEITASQLSVANLKSAITTAGSTALPDLVVLRTTDTQNTITYASYSDGLAIDVPSAKGSITIVGFGSKPLTIDAANKNRVISVGSADSTTTVNLGGMTITRGYVPTDSGGGVDQFYGTLTLTNVTISGNTARYGGGLEQIYGTLAMKNVTISGNTASSYGGGADLAGFATSLTNVTISSNTASAGGGVYQTSGTSTLTNVTISGNSANGRGGGMSVTFSSPTLVNCTFSGNSANSGGGMYSQDCPLVMTNCSFSGNGASGGAGGGLENASIAPSTSVVTNCTFSGNSGQYGIGGALSNSGAYCVLSVTNSIVWGSGNTPLRNSSDIASNLVISYSDIEGGYSGTGNISSDPQFVRSPYTGPDGVFGTADDGSGDVRLRIGSPALDMGSNAAVPTGIITDQVGNPRIQNGAVDMGAYEGPVFAAAPKTVYVDDSANGGTNGTSWTDAFTSLQSALQAATDGDTIRVAQGIYKPTTTTNRQISFSLRNAVSIYGGYAGFGATNPDDRDAILYPTVLSGDIGVSDVNADNSYHVVFSGEVDSALLDGLTITAGNASESSGDDSYGGGIYNTASSPTLVGCTFRGNAANIGGAIYNTYSSLMLTNCTVSGNWTVYGGTGVYDNHSSSTVNNSTFSENLGRVTGSGSALVSVHSSSLVLTNSIVWGSGSQPVYAFDVSYTPVITYSDIQGGYAGTGNVNVDPRFVRSPWAGPDGVFCTADDDYGDLRLRTGSPALDIGSNLAVPSEIVTDQAGNDRIQGGVVDLGAYEGATAAPAPKIVYVDIAAVGANTGSSWTNAFTSLQSALLAASDGDSIRVAGGTYKPTTTTNRDAAFSLRNAVAIYGGYAGQGAANPDARDTALCVTALSGDIGTAGDISDNSCHVVVSSGLGSATVLDGLTISAGNANRSSGQGNLGGGMYNITSSPMLANCTFSGNTASGQGGAIYNGAGSSPTLTNCVFVGNLSGEGAVFNIFSSSPILTNCTFSGNSLGALGLGVGGAVFNDTACSPTLTNCIVWDSGSQPVYNYNSSCMPVITYSDIQGGYVGTGNTGADPRFFRNPSFGLDGVWGTADDDYGDLRLQLSSPCIDAGNNTAPGLVGITADITGAPRFIDLPGVVDSGVGTAPIVDMGADELVIDTGLSCTAISENQPSGTVVGAFSTADTGGGLTFAYALVAGTGSSDNANFTIDGHQLLAATSFNCETKSSYSIRVRTTDQGGSWFEKTFTINVANVNENPTDIALSPSTVPEKQLVGTTVGAFNTVDPDIGDTFTYTLVNGVGDDDNASFTISGNVLQTAAVLNYATKNSYSIRVRAMDSGGLFFDRNITITVAYVPPDSAPTDISLSASSVAENRPSGTLVGSFTSTDLNVGNTFTYSLVSGTGSTNNSSFTISGSQLLTAFLFDYESKNSYSIRVRTTDQGGSWFEKAFTVTVTNVNETPAGLSLSATAVAENRPVGTTVGTFSGADPDAGSTFTYSLVSGTGSTNNGSFTISGSQLLTAASFNYEAKSSYSIRVRTTDQGGLWYERTFTIMVTNVDENPTDINLSASSIPENQAVGTTVGTLSAVDPDTGDYFNYYLVAGAGGTDNASFTISGSLLKTAAVFDFETKSSYSIRVRTMDWGMWFEKVFTITVIDGNDAPTDANVSASSVAENQPTGTVVGNITTTDLNVGNTFTYSLVSGTGSADNASFTISGNQLQTAASFNYEAKSCYSIRVRTTDQGGLWFEKAFTISVVNAAEVVPTITGISTDTGISSSDGITSDKTLVINGTSEPGMTISIYQDGIFTAMVTANASGNWLFDYSVVSLADGHYSFTATASDTLGHTTAASAAYGVTVDSTAPKVTAVYVRGSTWASGYLSFLAANTSGSSSTYGYAIPVGSGAAQLQTLPWRNLNRISIAFSEDVSIVQAQFAIVGSVGSYSVSGFSYNATDHVATWSLSAVIGPDKLYVAVAGIGASPVTDAAGNVLDGEWTNPSSYSQAGSTSSFPSGDGTAGGDFAFRFDVLPGDSTGGSLGKVNVADVAQTKSRSSLPVTASTYRSDFDGNNLVNVADVAYVKSKSSIYALPIMPPLPPTFGSAFSQVNILLSREYLLLGHV